MRVVYALRAVCPIDGYGLRGGAHMSVAINKRSLRPTGPGLVWTDRHCPECGHTTTGQRFAITDLDPQDRAAVEAYRRDRWPDLYGECHWCGNSLPTTRRGVLPLHTNTAGRRCKGTDRHPMRPVTPCRVPYGATFHLPDTTSGETPA